MHSNCTKCKHGGGKREGGRKDLENAAEGTVRDKSSLFGLGWGEGILGQELGRGKKTRPQRGNLLRKSQLISEKAESRGEDFREGKKSQEGRKSETSDTRG